MPGIVELANVSFYFEGEDAPVLKNLSFDMKEGSFNILVGPGGSGKSTLCNLFNGRIPHLIHGRMEGRVLVEGVCTADAEMKDLACRVGYVFQDPESMFATLSVEDEIAFGPENLLFDKETIQRTVDDLLELTGIGQYRRNLVWNLSGGQIQKLGLAAVLAMKPGVIILDEPTANLDPVATRQVHELILKLREENITVLLVTRELDDFMARADQVLVLDKGSLVAADAPYALLKKHGALMASLGIWLPETVEIGLALADAGFALDRIPITLEETVDLMESLGMLRPGEVLRAPVRNAYASTEPPLIEGKELKFCYSEDYYALKGVSLEIHRGEMLAVVGRNGAGKSTLAKLLIGLNRCREGDLRLFGRPSSAWKVPDLANHISLVFQNPEHQFLTDTVAEEIDYSLQSKGVFDPDEIVAGRNEILARLELTDEQELHPFALSAGKKRRLGVATMLVGDPKVLIVDEPTYGQDREMTTTLMKLMTDIKERGVSVVMISHDMRLVEEYADRVAVFSEGLKLFDGIPAELYSRPEILEQANLQPTLLNRLLKILTLRGIVIEGNISGTKGFLDLFLAKEERV